MRAYAKRLLFILIVFAVSTLSAKAQSFPNNLAANSVDPESDSIAISQMREKLDRIRIEQNRPTIALVLSGGGAKGAAYIGIFRYLEEAGIPVDMVCGTSMGGLMGGLYSMGYDSNEIEQIITSIDWSEMMSDNIDMKYLSFEDKGYKSQFVLSIPFYYDDATHMRREKLFDTPFDEGDIGTTASKRKILKTLPSGYITGFNVENMLYNLSVGYHEDIPFANLPVPFYCVSADLVSAKANYHTNGSLPKAMRSTMSIPGVFSPVRTSSRILVDGGTRNNFPVDIAKAMGADIIIGVEVAKRGATYSEINSVIDIVNCMITMLGDNARSNKDAQPDLFIKPETGSNSMLSFNSETIKEMIQYGYQAAVAREEDFNRIKEMLADARIPETKSVRKAVNLYKENVNISGIMVNGISMDEQNVFRKILNLKGYREISQTEINDALCRVMATGSFEDVNYSLHKDQYGDSYTLVFDCIPGQIHNFGMGVRLDTEEMAELMFNLRLNAHKLRGWRFDATAKVSSQQSVALSASYIPDHFAQLNAKVSFSHTRVDVQTGDAERLRCSTSILSNMEELSLSTVHGLFYDLRLGMRHEYFTMPDKFPLFSVSKDTPVEPYTDDFRKADYLTVFGQADFNTMNDKQFPTRGALVSAGLDVDVANFSCPDFSIVPILSLNAKVAIPVTKWLVLTPEAYYRGFYTWKTLDEQNFAYYHNNYVGGAMKGRYYRHQIPFMAANYPSTMRNNVLVANLDMRFKLSKKLYLFAFAGTIKEQDKLIQLFDSWKPEYWGYGAGIGYRTFFGPIKFNMHWSDIMSGTGGYLSIGYDF